MEEKRRGEIAIILVKELVRKKGVNLLSPKWRREIGNEVKGTGVNIDEAMEFMGGIIRELVDEALAKKPDEGVI